MIIGVLRERLEGERRVALIPSALPTLKKEGLEILVERQAGSSADFSNRLYEEKGAQIVERAEVFAKADILPGLRPASADHNNSELNLVRSGQILIAMADPLGFPERALQIAERGATLFALELIPRITRAQSMDVLSSMATVAGYKAVLLAAASAPKMFPMLMTAAGTIAPAKVFVIGAGVAGLMAIATAKRLGAVVRAYDVRAAVKEQVESLGAKFVELPLESRNAEGQGGYAQVMDEEFYQKQRALMSSVLAESDVVITTAAVPGKRSPLLITAEMVAVMPSGSVLVDLAAERGGNCALTKPDEEVIVQGVTILGPTNAAASVPHHASQMYSRNLSTFLLHLIKAGKLELNLEDPIIRETLICHEGKVVHPQVKAQLDEHKRVAS